MTSDQTHVIVGASLAGAKAAETLRAEGFDGRVVLIGAEERAAVRAPAAVEGLPARRGRAREGLRPRRELLLRARHRAAARPHAVEPGHRRATSWRSTTASGRATTDCCSPPAPSRAGSPIPGAELDGVLYLRSVQDSDALRERLDRGGAVVVIGAGWIGAEVAASARQRGLEVTVIEPASVPLERVLGAEVGAIYRDIHADHGVEMLLGTGVEAFEGDKAVERVRTSDGRVIECDFVVVGVGVAAAHRARRASRPRRRQRHPRRRAPRRPARRACSPPATSPTPAIPSTASAIRVEHWANALHQGPAAARNMLGQRRRVRPPAVLLLRPVRRRHGVLGLRPHWDRVVFRGDPASREFIAFWLSDDRVVAGMNVNVWDVTDPIRRLISERVAVDDRRLADPDVPLDQLVAAERGERRMNRLQALHDAGVSIWLDTLSRDLLDSGEFAALIAECAVTGATSNPTIFAKAITGSDRYDDQLHAAVASGSMTPQELFFELALDDVRRAADLLRPAYERRATAATASSPSSARPTSPTTPRHDRAGARAVGRLDRPNVMIKVPATDGRRSRRSRSSPRAASTSTSRCCSPSPATSR